MRPVLNLNGSGDALGPRVSLLASPRESGTTRPGGTVVLARAASEDPCLTYQVGSSLGTGPIPIDTRSLGLSPDALLVVSAVGLVPGVFAGYRGVLDSKGQAQARLNIPALSALIGLTIHTAFVTVDWQAPSAIRSISNTFSFTITST